MTAPINKVWGTTTPLIVTPMFELHRLDIIPWHRCSLHRHQFKHNAFYVLRGGLFIDTALPERHPDTDIGDYEKVWLDPGRTYTIAPGVRHQFRTASSFCVALEMYYTEPLSEDIIRSIEGGPV